MDKVKVILDYAKDFSLDAGLVGRLRRAFPGVSFVEVEGETYPSEQLGDAWTSPEMGSSGVSPPSPPRNRRAPR